MMENPKGIAFCRWAGGQKALKQTWTGATIK
jgi:hypothetical protein